MTKTLRRPYWVLLMTGLLVLAMVAGALAQTPPDKRLDELERQIRSLQQTVDALRRDLKAAEASRPGRRTEAAATPASMAGNDALGRIRHEGLKHSQVMQTLSYLADVIGPRLTGSPELKRANKWTSDKLASWGLRDPHLEAWGPFGRGWSLKRFSAQVVEPQAVPLIACPKAWSPGLVQPVVANVVYFDARTEADLAKYHGKLRGAIVLLGRAREGTPHFEPLARRWEEADLRRMANAGDAVRPRVVGQGPASRANGGGLGDLALRLIAGARMLGAAPALPSQRTLSFLTAEGAAVLVTPSPVGDAGTIFVADASVPAPRPSNREAKNSSSFWWALASGKISFSATPADTNAPFGPWSKNAPAVPAQIALSSENYGRLVRMIEQGEQLKMAVELQVKFCEDDPMAYNTIAEIPGSDLKDQIVMLGAHLDSWQAGTGATDNGAGVAAAMEAVRIITALKLRPRRTIRIGLWSGEEQGLLGSRAYVKKHFGEYADPNPAKAPKEQRVAATSSAKNPGKSGAANTNPRAQRGLVRQAEYEKLSVYFNLDNGAGKIRGVYLQGNEGEQPIFRSWLKPFRDLARIPSRWPTPTAPTTSRSMPSVCPPSSSSRIRSTTSAARIIRTRTSSSTLWPTTCSKPQPF